MAYQKLQVSTALSVIPSDYINIPNASTSPLSGSTTSSPSAGNDLVDSDATFKAHQNKVQVGDIVYSGSTIAVVSEVVSNTVLKLTDGNGVAVPIPNATAYSIYKNSNNGCVLYIGVSGNLEVETAGGSVVTFSNMPIGFVPVQVMKVLSSGTTATGIIALW